MLPFALIMPFLQFNIPVVKMTDILFLNKIIESMISKIELFPPLPSLKFTKEKFILVV